MAGINKVILVGNLGQDPEKKSLPSGESVVNISVATSESWVDKHTNERRERTEWHRVVIFGRQADVVAQYCRKGSKVYLEGKLQTRKWTDQNGQDRYSTEVVLSGIGSTVQLLDSRQSSADSSAHFDNGYGYDNPNNYAQDPYGAPTYGAQSASRAPQKPAHTYAQNAPSSAPSPYEPQSAFAPQNQYAHNAPPATAPQPSYPQSQQRTPQAPAVDQGFGHQHANGFDMEDDDLPF